MGCPMGRKKAWIAAGTLTLISAVGVVSIGPATAKEAAPDPASTQPNNASVNFQLPFSSAAVARCMPNAKVSVTVQLQDAQLGRDVFLVSGTGLPPDPAVTTLLT